MSPLKAGPPKRNNPEGQHAYTYQPSQERRPNLEELEDDDDLEEDTETFELLVSFMVDSQEYGLYIPLDPFLVLVRMVDGQAELLNDEELDRIQPRIEAELEEREWPD